MTPNDRFEPRCRRARPPEPKVSSNFFQGIGKRRKINPGEDKREEVYGAPNGGCCYRAFPCAPITTLHSFQERRLVAAVMNELRVRDRGKNIDELVPYALFC